MSKKKFRILEPIQSKCRLLLALLAFSLLSHSYLTFKPFNEERGKNFFVTHELTTANDCKPRSVDKIFHAASIRVPIFNNDEIENKISNSVQSAGFFVLGDIQNDINAKPFWATLWFKIFLIIVIVTAVYLAIKIRLKAAEKRSYELEEQVELRTEVLRILNANLMEEIKMRKEAEKQLIKNTEELKESNASKDKFFSIIAHDLKNPFQGIFGYSQVLSEDFHFLSEKEKKEIATNIYSSSKTLYDLLINLLEWSRLQVDKVEIKSEKISLYDRIEEINRLLLPNAERKKISIINQVDKSLLLHADDYMLGSILQNLVSNAIKFTHPDGHVRINSEVKHLFAVISIEDNGIGISQDDLDKIFNIGVRYTTQGTDKEMGTGLGLILCKEMIEKQGGNIWVESELGSGSTFKFTLPMNNGVQQHTNS